MNNFIGIDVGGTGIKVALVDEQGQLHRKASYSIDDLRLKGDFQHAFIDCLVNAVNTFPETKDVGLVLPGTLSKDRQSTKELANIPELDNFPLVEKLQEKLPSHHFSIENDANAAALGEYYYTPGELPDDFLFFTLGTGIGSAAVLDRKLFVGGNGNGMEAGHIVSSDGRTTEDNIGKNGILALAKDLLKRDRNNTSPLHKVKNLSPKDLKEAADNGDELALEVFDEVGKFLGECIVSTVRILDVTHILIGGGISPAFPHIEASMHKTIKNFLTPYYLETMTIELAGLGNDAGILGAAALARHAAQTNEQVV